MRFFIFLLALSVSLPAYARPVSYPGGWMLMVMNDADSNAAQLNYTLTPRFALGIQHEYFRDSEIHMDAVTVDNLLKRWNLPDSQANLYLKSGLGAAYGDDETNPAAYTGMEIDWEDRRFFTLYENRFFWAEEDERFISHTARIGVAPYVGDYGDLHTWLMLQADYDAGKDDDFSLTPMVRLFKDDYLVRPVTTWTAACCSISHGNSKGGRNEKTVPDNRNDAFRGNASAGASRSGARRRG